MVFARPTVSPMAPISKPRLPAPPSRPRSWRAQSVMLGQNPYLGYRDVQEILALSASSRLDAGSHENGFSGFNGGGLMFDREGGFGRLDAGAAVALARNWSQTSTRANEQQL